jgi:hypothetical protein
LVEAYAWRFGAAYGGGVFFLNVGRTKGSRNLKDRYNRELRRIAALAGLNSESIPTSQLVSSLAVHLADQEKSVLWVVDDISCEVDVEALKDLVLPAGPIVGTVLVLDEVREDLPLPAIDVGPLPDEVTLELLARWRDPDTPAEVAAARRVAMDLGGHAGSAAGIGAMLRDRQGLLSYVGLATLPESRTSIVAHASQALDRTLSLLGPDESFVLRVAAVSGLTALPAHLVADLLGDDGWAAMAHVGLRRRLLVQQGAQYGT